MSLVSESPPASAPQSAARDQEIAFQQLKTALHQRLVECLDLSGIDGMETAELRRQVAGLAAEEARHVTNEVALRQRLATEVLDEVFGLGPLEPVLRDDSVNDILVNDAHTVYVERQGRLELTDVVFADDEHLIRVIQRMVARIGRRIDESNPMVDGRLPDGSRINAVIPPLALDGPSLSIRRFGARPLTLEDLCRNHSLPQHAAAFLAAAVRARINLLISGGTGAGKTTLLNCLSAYIGERERIVTIEDAAELQLQHRHRVRLETRPENVEGAGQVTQRELVRNALRMRPDRILVGEVRGAEVWDMLQAMNSGHDGSLTTVHANSARDALRRLELMAALSGSQLPIPVVRQHVAAASPLLVHVARLSDGRRRVVQIAELAPLAEEDYTLHEIFGFRQRGVSQQGAVWGDFYTTGNRPRCVELLESAGASLPSSMFTARNILSVNP